jgi:hypothetical protein
MTTQLPKIGQPVLEAKVRRIEKLSGRLRAACTGLMVIVSMGFLAIMIALCVRRPNSLSLDSGVYAVSDWGLRSRSVVGFLLLATAAVVLYGLGQLRRLFDNYSRGEIFTRDSARCIRGFGISCLLLGVVEVAWDFVPAVISEHPPHTFAVNFHSLFVGAVIVVLSWFAEMAAGLKEENELTI